MLLLLNGESHRGITCSFLNTCKMTFFLFSNNNFDMWWKKNSCIFWGKSSPFSHKKIPSIIILKAYIQIIFIIPCRLDSYWDECENPLWIWHFWSSFLWFLFVTFSLCLGLIMSSHHHSKDYSIYFNYPLLS